MASFPSNLAVQTQSHDRVTFQSRVNGVRSPNPRSSMLHPSFPIHLHPSAFVTIFRFPSYICSSCTLHLSSHHSYVYIPCAFFECLVLLLRLLAFRFSLLFHFFTRTLSRTPRSFFFRSLPFFVFLSLCRLLVSLLFSSSAPRVKPLRLALEVISISF